MVVFLLVAILAVLLFGAPLILEAVFQGGAIALMLLVGFIVLATGLALIVELFQKPWEVLNLLGWAAVFAAWIWGFAKFKFVRWGFVVLLVATIVVAQLWPVMKAAGV